jgi:hypothetical protein
MCAFARLSVELFINTHSYTDVLNQKMQEQGPGMHHKFPQVIFVADLHTSMLTASPKGE